MFFYFVVVEDKLATQRSGQESGFRQQGAYPNLLRELNAEDPEAFRQFHRLDRESFETILAMVAPLITKEGTHMRRSLPPGEKLSITLRFLATGK